MESGFKQGHVLELRAVSGALMLPSAGQSVHLGRSGKEVE